MKAKISQIFDDLGMLVREFSTGALMTWLLAFLLIDGIAVVTDLVTTLLKELNPDLPYWLLWWFRLDTEWYVWSTYGYLKLILISAVLLICAARTKLPSFMFLFGAYAYAAMDDMFLLHERSGRMLASMLEIPAVVGETLYFMAVGIGIMALLCLAVLRSVPKYRLETILLSAGMMAIGFFAVFVNLIEGFLAGTYRALAHLVSVTDDGGELVVSSFVIGLSLMVLGKVNHAFHTSKQDKAYAV